MRPPDASSTVLVLFVTILTGIVSSTEESRKKRSIVDFDYAVQDGITSGAMGHGDNAAVDEALIERDRAVVETGCDGNVKRNSWSRLSRKSHRKRRNNSNGKKKRAKRDVYERLLADFDADIDRLVDYFDEDEDLKDDSQMVIRMKRGISESGGGNDVLKPSLDVAFFPDLERTIDDDDRISNEPVTIRRRGGGEADKDESGLRAAGSDLGSGSPSGSTTAAASEAVLTRKDIRDIARRSDMRQVLRWLAQLARGNKDTVMHELSLAKDQVEGAGDSVEDASEEIIVTPDRASNGGGWRSGNRVFLQRSPESSAVRGHRHTHKHKKHKTKKRRNTHKRKHHEHTRHNSKKTKATGDV